jgi:DNA helicase-2/ATP-dependent DNA helicase PcrA
LHAANTLIRYNNQRLGKDLWTEKNPGKKILLFSAANERAEAEFVAERIVQAHRQGRALEEMAVLYRTNAQSRVLEETFTQKGIAYRLYGGVRFFERPEIKDALSYCRLLLNRHDDLAFERAVNMPKRSIGEKTLDKVQSLAQQKGISLWEAAKHLSSKQASTDGVACGLGCFLKLIDELDTVCVDLPLDQQLLEVIKRSGLKAHYEQALTEEARSKWRNLQELLNAAKEFLYEANAESSTLSLFLAHAALEPAGKPAQEHEPSVQMMTLHGAKGLEFLYVFMVGMEDGLFPAEQAYNNAADFEEERRLCYVGMTRAISRLVLSYAQERRVFGRKEQRTPSPFLSELPSSLLLNLSESKATPSFFYKKRTFSGFDEEGTNVHQEIARTRAL